MQISGKNLELVKAALVRAISDVHMEWGACPDVVEYAEDLRELEAECDRYKALLESIERRELESARLREEHHERSDEYELRIARERASHPVQPVRANVLEFKRR